jgi:hypothetical protein
MASPNESRLVVALAGTDDWIRPHLTQRLIQAGTDVRDMSTGTASLFGVDVLVQLPALAPRSRSGERDVGLRAASVTFSALALSKVGRAVVVSRVGSDPGAPVPYFSALGDLEQRALRATSKLTIVRLTHPFGPSAAPGAIAEAAAELFVASEEPFDDDVPVQPIYLDDAVAAIGDAVDGRVGHGLVELGGPDTMGLREFAKLATSVCDPGANRSRRAARHRTRLHRSEMTGVLMTASVAARKFALTRAERHRLREVWGDPRPGRSV